MALIDEVKTALRVSLDDADINLQLQGLIDAAKDDLIHTADINASFTGEGASSPLVKLAIITFVKAYWVDNEDEAEKLMRSYNSIKGKLSMSSFYSTYEE